MNFEGPLSIEIYVKHKEHMAKRRFSAWDIAFDIERSDSV